jgi:hypothetical protein
MGDQRQMGPADFAAPPVAEHGGDGGSAVRSPLPPLGDRFSPAARRPHSGERFKPRKLLLGQLRPD